MTQARKKICFVATVPETFKAFILTFADYLHSQGGYDISLICNPDGEFEKSLPEYLRFIPVSMKRGVSLQGIGAMLKMRKIFRQEKFDLVQYSTPNAACYASIAAKMSHVPVRLYCQWGIRYMGFGGILRRVFKWLEKITCKNSTFIEVESNHIRDFSISEGLYAPERSCVIWNGSACGVNTKKFDFSRREQWRRELRAQYKIAEEDIVFSFAGRLTADKGLNELMEAFSSIAASHTNAKLIIMGRPEDMDSLRADLLERLRHSDRVIFTGPINNVEQFYAASDVFVAPSYREGFGLVVIEAAAMGLPAVVSDVPGQIDAIVPGKTGLTCKVKDAASLEQGMLVMLRDKELREKMGEEAHKFAYESFEQNQLFQRLMQHREELILKESN